MKDLLAQQLEAFVKTLKAKRPEWDLIGDASVTAQQAGLQRLHELLLEVYDVNLPFDRGNRTRLAEAQKVLRLQWPELELAMQAAKDLGWRVKLGRSFTTWTVETTASLYGPRVPRGIGERWSMGRMRAGGTALLAEFTVDVRVQERSNVQARMRRDAERVRTRVAGRDLYDLYLSWPSEFKLTVPELQKELERVERLVSPGDRGFNPALRQWLNAQGLVSADWPNNVPQQLQRRADIEVGAGHRLDEAGWTRAHRPAAQVVWAYGPAELDDVLDDEALETGWRPGQTYEVGLLCSFNHRCPYSWRSMVSLYEHAPFWFACVHDVIAQTEKLVGG